MVKPVVLALVVQNPKTKAVSVLSLTPEFTFSVLPKAPGRGVGPTIEVRASENFNGSAVRLPVDSLTVVYGENGEGKTTLLLDVCRTLRPSGRERPLGTIWRDSSGTIRLDPGSHLTALRLSGPMTSHENVRSEERFGTVFYTTSPFESARRRELTANGTIDVTPSFGTNSFNGTSLCQAARSLPNDVPFIRRVRVQLEISDQLNVGEELQQIASTMYPEYIDEAGMKRTPRALQRIDRLTKFASSLDARSGSLLAMELRRTRLDGPKAAERLLLELDKGAESLAGNIEVKKFLDSRDSQRLRITSPQILKALKQLKKAAADESPKELLAYPPLLDSLSPAVIAALQEAENLGLLRWNFLELSSGQIALLMLFASLSAALETLRKRETPSVMLVVDEGEMFMHPAWQRKYLRDLTKFIGHYRSSFKEVHLILATHSLIVAGDAPPNRLFDVKSGEMRNSFAYGPKEVLRDVYGVDEFAGNMAEALYEKIAGFLRTTTSSTKRESEARSLIEQIASPELRTYLLEELQRRRHPKDA